jgi:hypothetical protein
MKRLIVLLVVMFPLLALGAEPVLERPTLRCLGVYWIVEGGEKNGASVVVEYRKAGDGTWRQGHPLFHVERGKHEAEKYGSRLDVPAGAALFAGSVVDLTPDIEYELKLTLSDKAGAKVEKSLSGRTRGEPRAAKNAPMRHMVPASTADAPPGTGTAENPFRGLAAAQAAAKAGDVFLLHAGVYEGTFEVKRSGEEGRPIVWRGEDAARVILSGQGSAAKRPSRTISASGVHDVYFENLTIRDADFGVVAHDSTRLVVRGCHIDRVDYGLTATRNDNDQCRDLFIADNVIEGPCTWPRTKGIENPRGIQVTGAGHVICYNRIRGFSDAIDTYNSKRCEAIDFYNNEISECTDDGSEMDYSQRNVRCFDNRFTNVYQGISVQPVFGGPVYVFRNAIYNVVAEPFKMHNSPSGAIFYHNTIVKQGPPLLLYTQQPASNLVMRNNLFVGTSGNYAWECNPRMIECNFDYDGFGGGPFPLFLKWNGERYRTFAEMRAKAPIERHATLVSANGVFASGVTPPADPKKVWEAVDLRLAAGSRAIDAGQALPGFDDGFTGKGPDLGAYEAGAALPHYGPRGDGGMTKE